MIAVAIVGGLLADLVVVWLRPGPTRVNALRVAAFFGPAGVCTLYLLALALTRGITWPITLWLGSIVVCGAIGIPLSYLIVVPRCPPRLGSGKASLRVMPDA